MTSQELVAVCNVPPIDNTEPTMMQSLVCCPPKTFGRQHLKYAGLADVVPVLHCAHCIMDMWRVHMSKTGKHGYYTTKGELDCRQHQHSSSTKEHDPAQGKESIKALHQQSLYTKLKHRQQSQQTLGISAISAA